MALQCTRCGYSLVGMRAGQVCPECSLAVERSLNAGAELRYADPDWLARLLAGVRALRVSQRVLVNVVGYYWLASILGVPLANGGKRVPVIGEGIATVVDAVIAAGPPVLRYGIIPLWAVANLAGAWLMSEPTQPPFGMSRRLAWTWRAAAAALTVWIIFTQARVFVLWALPAWFDVVRATGFHVLLGAHLGCMLEAMAQMSRRIEEGPVPKGKRALTKRLDDLKLGVPVLAWIVAAAAVWGKSAPGTFINFLWLGLCVLMCGGVLRDVLAGVGKEAAMASQAASGTGLPGPPGAVPGPVPCPPPAEGDRAGPAASGG